MKISFIEGISFKIRTEGNGAYGGEFDGMMFEENGRLSRALTGQGVLLQGVQRRGRMLSPKQAEAAHEAGASFIISPNTSEAVIARTKELGMVSVPGAMTPTEILKAYELGADIVKLFPAGVLGIEYFKAVRAPLSGIPLAAVAGITPENIALFEAAGAAAYGISSSLYLKNAIRERRFDAMTEAAKRFFDAMKA